VEVALSNYLGSAKVLRCPSDRKQIYEQTGSSYAWNSLLNGQEAEHLKVFNMDFDPHQIPVMFARGISQRTGRKEGNQLPLRRRAHQKPAGDGGDEVKTVIE